MSACGFSMEDLELRARVRRDGFTAHGSGTSRIEDPYVVSLSLRVVSTFVLLSFQFVSDMGLGLLASLVPEVLG